MSVDRVAFDREPTLGALLGGATLDGLGRALAALLPGGFRLADAEGTALAGAGEISQAVPGTPISLDFDVIGRLEGSADRPEALAAAAQIVALLARQTRRYQMAADLHMEAVKEDYLALQEKHRKLEESEARYRSLSESLERRVAEQVKQIDAHRRQLYEAEKKASVGQLAAGMAHEINNPLGFICSNLAMAKRYLGTIAALAGPVGAGDGAAAKDYWQREDLGFVLEDFATLLEESAGGADRVARIVADLKEFSNIDRAGRQLVDLNRQLRSVCNVAAPQVERSARLELDLGEI
ncbi:MAG: two-component sensor histidine kinase, partial [Chloroflexota bacterium]